MKYQVREHQKFNVKEPLNIVMKNGLHIQQYMDGKFKVYGLKFHQVMILMQLIEHQEDN
jgi:hypothetical protein